VRSFLVLRALSDSPVVASLLLLFNVASISMVLNSSYGALLLSNRYLHRLFSLYHRYYSLVFDANSQLSHILDSEEIDIFYI